MNLIHYRKIDQAIRVAEEGLRLFPDHLTRDLREFLNKFYETRLPEKYRENIKNLFFQECNWNYYEKLKKLSSQEEWNELLKEIIAHFSKEWRFGESVLVDVYLKEGMFDEALREVLAENNLDILSRYHRDLSAKYPKEYFHAYKELLIPFADSKTGRRHYRKIVTHLKEMRGIKGCEIEFIEFVGMLKEKYANRPAFLDEMRRL